MNNISPLVILDGRELAAADRATVLQQVQKHIPAPLLQNVRQLGAGAEEFSAPQFPVLTLSDLVTTVKQGHFPWLGYIPLSKSSLIAPLPLPNDELTDGSPFIAPWIPTHDFPDETAQASPVAIASWIASADLVSKALQASRLFMQTTPWSLLDLAEILETAAMPFRWGVVAAGEQGAGGDRPNSDTRKVLAIVPHYQCEPWLHRCLTSLVNQSRPLDNIVVVDDGSPRPPIEIVSAFPQVTLLTSPQTVGPYRLVQQVIETTRYDDYLFQDADDWSSCDRLANLLTIAETTSADLVGTQEIRMETANAESATLFPVHYPLDVNWALSQKPGHPLLHPTSLVRRRLVEAVGGFATGLRFGGDTEFLLRATFVGRIVNVPDYGYFRQKRPQSLTTNPETGLGSPARQALLSQLKQRFRANKAALQAGKPCNLAPLSRSPVVPLTHHWGPALGAME